MKCNVNYIFLSVCNTRTHLDSILNIHITHTFISHSEHIINFIYSNRTELTPNRERLTGNCLQYLLTKYYGVKIRRL